jgi:hypothetical protein
MPGERTWLRSVRARAPESEGFAHEAGSRRSAARSRRSSGTPPAGSLGRCIEF